MPSIRSNRPLPDLPHAARAYIAGLPPGTLFVAALAELDRTGIPAWKVALVLDDGAALPGVMPNGYGYGLTDSEALTGALGELAEMTWPSFAAKARLAAGKAYLRGSYGDLRRSLGDRAVVDPFTLCLPAGSPVSAGTDLLWEKAVRRATGETVLVPLDVAAADSAALADGYRPFTTLISNGLGAGPTRDWAVAHGLCELLQRDGNGTVFRALDRGVGLDMDEAASGDVIAILDRLETAGVRAIPKFASDEFGLANVFIVGHDLPGHRPTHPIMVTAAGEACDPDRNRALRKALLEFAAARVRKTFSHGPLDLIGRVAPPGYVGPFLARALPGLAEGDGRALLAMQEWARSDADTLMRRLAEPVYAIHSHKPLSALPAFSSSAPESRQAHLFAAMEAAGLDVLYVDGSPPGHPVHVVKVIVPTLEVETMSYARIGERNARKLIEMDSPLIAYGDASTTRQPIRLTEDAAARLGGRQPLFDLAAAACIVGELYPLYREPEAHVVAALASGWRADGRPQLVVPNVSHQTLG